MPADHEPDYDFRPVTAKDFPRLRTWLAAPHVAQWWGDGEKELAEIRDNLDSIAVEPLIIELDGKAIGFLQSYDPHLEDDHPYQDQPFGTLGIDMLIGEADLVAAGHGPSIIRQFVDLLFEEGVPRVIVDPDPANVHAIRAYEKAGFVRFDERTSDYGPALMMACDAPDEEL